MPRPDPNNIKLAGSGTTSDWNLMVSTISGKLVLVNVMVPAVCTVPSSVMLHRPKPNGEQGKAVTLSTSEKNVSMMDVSVFVLGS